MLGSLIGAGASLLGGALGGSGPKVKYRPFDTSSAFGTADYDKRSRQLSLNLSPEQQALYDLYGSQAMEQLAGGQFGQQGAALAGQALGMMPGLFGGALGASAVDPVSMAAYNQQMGGLSGMMGGLFGQAAQLGLQPGGQAEALRMFGLGEQLMGSQPQSYQDVYQQRLGLLREQAAPFEQRAQDQLLNRMYSMGQMGAHTGGLQQMEAFGQGLAQADTTRQLDAMGLSEQLYGRDLSAALQRQGIGAGLMGGGQAGLLNALGQQGSMLGMAGNFGQALGGLFGNQLGANQTFNELVNARAQQRMASASQLFGFGQGIGTQAMQTGMGLQQGQAGLLQNLLAQAGLGHQAGGGQAAAQAAQAQAGGGGSLLGGVLQGLGSGMMANPGAYGGLGAGIAQGGAKLFDGFKSLMGGGLYTPTIYTPRIGG